MLDKLSCPKGLVFNAIVLGVYPGIRDIFQRERAFFFQWISLFLWPKERLKGICMLKISSPFCPLECKGLFNKAKRHDSFSQTRSNWILILQIGVASKEAEQLGQISSNFLFFIFHILMFLCLGFIGGT